MCARSFLAVIELLFGSVLKVFKLWIIYKCACVCNFYFAYLRHKTIFYVGTLLRLTVRVCVRARSYVRLGVVLLVQMGC